MIENETKNYEADFIELDDVLDHAFFNEEEELSDMEDEFVFISGQSKDFRSLDEL
ncbi:MAG: hypothetical protein R8G66_10025 [Cytophagales bacterium]|nr:hypothetical protein [Cytophagales bacterium]